MGYATLGQIGFEQRLEYAAIGSVTNLASRLCDEAKAGQIVVSRRVYGMVEPWVEARALDDLQLKGFNHPVLAMEILSLARGSGECGGCVGGAKEDVVADKKVENNPMRSRRGLTDQ